MSAATPRAASNTPDVRQLGVAIGALIIAVALVVAVMVSQRATAQAPSAPLAAPVPAVQHDHGWSSTSPLSAPAHDNGWAATDTATSAGPGGPIVRGRQGGGIVYTGIPYSAGSTSTGNGGNGTRLAR